MISVADRIVHELRQKVITATGGLTCSAGIACNPMLAKVRKLLCL
jgi:nucleotidyltransferase/DNA polymerase involved in DNA repair